MPGPPPTPTEILKMRGSRLVEGRENEVQFTKGIGDCPGFLAGEVGREWERKSKELEAVGILQHVDSNLLYAWCVVWAQFSAIAAELATMKTLEMTAQRTMLEAQDKLLAKMIAIGQQFGFSPAARTRVKSEAKAGGGIPTRKRG